MSEHTVDGLNHVFEIHFVFVKNDNTSLSVFGQFIDFDAATATNTTLDNIFNSKYGDTVTNIDYTLLTNFVTNQNE